MVPTRCYTRDPALLNLALPPPIASFVDFSDREGIEGVGDFAQRFPIATHPAARTSNARSIIQRLQVTTRLKLSTEHPREWVLTLAQLHLCRATRPSTPQRFRRARAGARPPSLASAPPPSALPLEMARRCSGSSPAPPSSTPSFAISCRSSLAHPLSIAHSLSRSRSFPPSLSLFCLVRPPAFSLSASLCHHQGMARRQTSGHGARRGGRRARDTSHGAGRHGTRGRGDRGGNRAGR
jgi:hypothetical protein